MTRLLAWLVLALAVAFVLVVLLSGCAQPTATASKVAAANPYCIAYCTANLTGIENNRADRFSPTIGATTASSKTKMTTVTEQP